MTDILKNLVWEALDRARDNVDDIFYSQPDCIIAIDLVSYESSLEDLDPEILEPYIASWKKAVQCEA